MVLSTSISPTPLCFPSHLRRRSPRWPPRQAPLRPLNTHQRLNTPPLHTCTCLGRRRLLLGSPMLASAFTPQPPDAGALDDPLVLTCAASYPCRPSRPEWYQSLYARLLNGSMGFYESAIASYKSEVFKRLSLEGKNVLEIGIGTGPNLKYYAGARNARVYGVDPNTKMEKYVREAATAAGLAPESFSFLQGVAEALPVKDNSMDAVIGTLVMCSVSDLNMALKEVLRVLKPGGAYIFIEHVAAQDGTFLRFIQSTLDPLQQLLSDGCHLTRHTGKDISEAGFSDAQINMASIPNLFIFGPHVYGFANK